MQLKFPRLLLFNFIIIGFLQVTLWVLNNHFLSTLPANLVAVVIATFIEAICLIYSAIVVFRRRHYSETAIFMLLVLVAVGWGLYSYMALGIVFGVDNALHNCTNCFTF